MNKYYHLVSSVNNKILEVYNSKEEAELALEKYIHVYIFTDELLWHQLK